MKKVQYMHSDAAYPQLFSFEGTCTPTPPIWGYMEFFEGTVCGSLYYCPIKHCLKHCVCFHMIWPFPRKY